MREWWIFPPSEDAAGEVNIEKTYPGDVHVIEATPARLAADDMLAALKLIEESIQAAEIEGLAEAIAETTDERLKDLLVRRVFYHRADMQAAIAKAEEGK